jgi:hypothetical protein
MASAAPLPIRRAWAAQIDGDDRRFAAIDCDDRWAGPRTAAKTEYFAKLNDLKQGPYNITLAFARYLYDLDVDNFEPAAHITPWGAAACDTPP